MFQLLFSAQQTWITTAENKHFKSSPYDLFTIFESRTIALYEKMKSSHSLQISNLKHGASRCMLDLNDI